MVWSTFSPRLLGVNGLARMVWSTFFSTFACLTEGGGSKAIWAMPIYRTNTFQKGASFSVLKFLKMKMFVSTLKMYEDVVNIC